MDELTQLLDAAAAGNQQAVARILPLVYDQLRKIAAARVEPGQTLDATELVHEAYLRLFQGEARPHWESRRHFYAAAAQAMRHILVDAYRRGSRQCRGGGLQRQPLEGNEPAATPSADPTDLLALDEALDRLKAKDPRKAQVVELRFFTGLSVAQIAEVLGVAESTVAADWAYAKAWLKQEMEKG